MCLLCKNARLFQRFALKSSVVHDLSRDLRNKSLTNCRSTRGVKEQSVHTRTVALCMHFATCKFTVFRRTRIETQRHEMSACKIYLTSFVWGLKFIYMVFKNAFPLIKKQCAWTTRTSKLMLFGKPVYLGNDAKHLNVFVVSLGGLYVDVVIAVFLKVSTRNLFLQ